MSLKQWLYLVPSLSLPDIDHSCLKLSLHFPSETYCSHLKPRPSRFWYPTMKKCFKPYPIPGNFIFPSGHLRLPSHRGKLASPHNNPHTPSHPLSLIPSYSLQGASHQAGHRSEEPAPARQPKTRDWEEGAGDEVGRDWRGAKLVGEEREPWSGLPPPQGNLWVAQRRQ